MASNILSLPFRRTHTVSLSDAIKDYISEKYDQHPDMFMKDLEEVDKLRSLAVNAIEPHVTGIKKLQSYAAQLVWLGGKFPVDIGVEFAWYPAIGYHTERPISQNNLRFELANIVFNLAVMYSQLAMSSNRGTPDGLKTACNYFCAAAGTLQHLRTNIVPEMRTTPPEDMDDMTLEGLEYLMLAQAQECFWQKAVKDGMKDATIAKLAAKVSDLYSDSMDFSVKSDAISSEWIHHSTAKHHHFAAAAQYRQACDCLEKRKYGEEVARLRDSLTCVNEALKETRYINKTVLADLNGLKNRVQEDLKRSEKDNDMIYLLPVPPKPELKTLDRASMVSSKIPKELSEPLSMLGDQGELGRALFSRLVPYSVHVAASIYADKRDRTITRIIEELDELTAQMHELMSSLNLPGSLQALEKPLGLPPGLIAHAEEIRQQDGIDRLVRSVEETNRLKANDTGTFEEGVQFLRAEVEEDEAARKRYGTDRWTRPPPTQANPKLYAQIDEIQGYLKAAAASDETVLKKIRENEKCIVLLSGNDRELENFVPSSKRASIPPAIEREVIRLRTCLNEVGKVESRRHRKTEALKAKAKHDDVNPDLLKEAARLEREYPMQNIEAVQFEALFDQRLKRYDSDRAMNTSEASDQSQILKRLRDANTAFTTARRGDTSTRQRETALQQLETAYFKYKEIVSNLDAGRKFYNDLVRIVTRFRDEARSFAYSRRADATARSQDITARNMQSMSLQDIQHQQQLQPGNPPLPQQQRQGEPLAAPMPTRVSNGPPPSGMWNPEMGIRFGPPPGGGPSNQEGVPQAGPQGGRWSPSKGLRFG